MTIQHEDLGNTEFAHNPYRWIVADSSARTGLTVASADVGKLALQQSDNTTWVLVDDSPMSWVSFATGDQGALADTAVQPARQIIAGTGLSGTGNLAADVTLGLDSNSQSSLGLADTALQPGDIGTSVQAYDAGLASIAGLTTAADEMVYLTGVDAYAVTSLTAAGRALLDDANAAAQIATLGLASGITSVTNAQITWLGNAETAVTWTGNDAAFAGNIDAPLADIDNIRIDGNTISSTDTNGNININPGGTGSVRITTTSQSGFRVGRGVGAGDDINTTTVSVCNTVTDTLEGRFILGYENSATTPKGYISFVPRNTTDTSGVVLGSLTFTKTSGANTDKVELFNYNAKGLTIGADGASSFTGELGVGGASNAGYGLISNSLPIAVIRTANDTTDTNVLVTGRGNASGNTGAIYSTGGGANNVTALGIKIGSTEVADFSSALLAVTGAISATTGITVATGQDVLDAYDAGTYTATLTCGTSGTVTLNASYDTLAYVRIGDLCHVQGIIRNSAVSSPTGTLSLNLPFTAASLTDLADYSRGVIYVRDASTLALRDFSLAATQASSNALIQTATGADFADAASEMAATTQIYVSIQYIVA